MKDAEESKYGDVPDWYKLLEAEKAEVKRLRGQLAEYEKGVRCCKGCPDCMAIGWRAQVNGMTADIEELKRQLVEAHDTISIGNEWKDNYRAKFHEARAAQHAAELELLESERKLAALRERWEKVLGDDEWWEEIELEPYNGDARTALLAEYCTLAATENGEQG